MRFTLTIRDDDKTGERELLNIIKGAGFSLITMPPLANAKNGKDWAQMTFDAKSRTIVSIDLILRNYYKSSIAFTFI
jgi:hypothetical protein